VIGDLAAVPHQDDEWLKHFRVLVADVIFDVKRRIGVERGAQVGGDEHGEAPWRRRGHRAGNSVGRVDEQRALRHEHQREERDETNRDAPVEAAGTRRYLSHSAHSTD
jgi:hypothetical protein